MMSPTPGPLRDVGVQEADVLYKQLMDFSDESNIAVPVANYGKLAQVRELLTQKYAKRIEELAGAKLKAAQATDPGVPKSALELMDRYVASVCGPLHKIIGSTLDPSIGDVIEAKIRGWIGDAEFETLITELNADVLAYASIVPSMTEEDLRNAIDAQRQALQQRLQSPLPKNP